MGWLWRGARAGSIHAQYELGCTLIEQDEKSILEGLQWLEIADRRGHPGAKRMLKEFLTKHGAKKKDAH